MKGMFCPNCGKPGKGLCATCFLEKKTIHIKEIEISACECGRYLYRGVWDSSLKHPKSIKEIVERNLIVPPEIGIEGIDVTQKEIRKGISLNIQITGKYIPDPAEQIKIELDGTIKIKKVVCPTCSKLSGNYYEAILQLRMKPGDSKGIIEEIDYDFISNVEDTRGGVDMYVTSTKYAKQIARKFREKGFLIKESAKRMGMKDGRDVYHPNVVLDLDYWLLVPRRQR